ncbi:MAG: class I adenylate-forming enzyme family protein [Thermomicrobiales bacterium]
MPETQFHSIAAAIANWARLTPNAPMAIAPGQPDITWSEFAGLTAEFGAALRSHGIGPRDRVAILMPPSRDAMLTVLATTTAAAAAPLDASAPIAELSTILSRLRPALVLASPDLMTRASSLGYPTLAVGPGPSLEPGATQGEDADARPGPQDIAIIVATSGSTGEPRLVPRHHGLLVAGTLPYARALALGPSDRWLCLSQPQHVITTSPAIITLLTGGAAIFPPTLTPENVADTIRTTGPTWLLSNPAFYRGIAASLSDSPPDPTVRILVSAGAPLDPGRTDELRRIFDAPIANDYGMPEAMSIALALPGDGQTDAVRFRPLDGVEIGVADESGTLLPLGEEGEIVTRGAHVFGGYIDDPEANTAAFLPNGWFRTGDSGVLDDTGAFHITGRISQIINRGGQRISPAEIEATLLEHPEVEAAGVYGVPDEALGEDVRAAIVLRPGAAVSARELRRWMLDRLSATKVPRNLSFLSALPMTANDKIARAELAAAVTAAEQIAATATVIEPPAPVSEPIIAPSPSPAPAPEEEPMPESPAHPQLEIDAPPAEPAAAPVAAFPWLVGPVQLDGTTVGLCDDSWTLKNVTIPIVATQPIEHLIINGFVPYPELIGRAVRLFVNGGYYEFVLPALGPFGLRFPVDIEDGEHALIELKALEPWNPAVSARKSTKKDKGKNKDRKKDFKSTAVIDSRNLGFVLVNLTFVPGRV